MVGCVTDPHLEALETATGFFLATIAEIPAGSWFRPTPCDEWDLAALVDHVAGGNRFTIDILGGATAEDAMHGLVDFFGASYVRRESAVRTATRQHGAFVSPGGPRPRVSPHRSRDAGRERAGVRLHELIVHTWDIARAIGTEAVIPHELVV